MAVRKKAPSYHEVTKIAAKEGAKAAILAFEQAKRENIQQQADRRLRNTKLLLRKYRVFKHHADMAVFSEQEKEEDSCCSVLEILDGLGTGDELYVESIRKSARRTKIIVQHIDRMIDIYKAYSIQCGRAEDWRRYEIIRALYIDEPELGTSIPTQEDIAEMKDIHPRTVRKDVNAAVGILSALIFGIDSLGKL